MNLLSVENLSKSYVEKILFKNISFGIEEGDKIGLIGVNGTGKSTFLKVLAGIDFPDQGTVTVGNNVRIEYLPQNPNFDDDATVLQQVFKSNAPVMQVLREYEHTVEMINNIPGDDKLQKKLILLSQQMDAWDAWQLESEAKIILTKLGIANFAEKVGKLSGGQRKRIALASALINPAELLILDEPTNHIDNETVDWLEQYLNKRKGALIMVTHDRYFLDRVVNRIIELDRGSLYSYSGNYSKFLELKVEREEQQQASEKKRQNLLRNELAWIKRGAKARTTKQKARIDRFEKLQQEKPEIAADKLEIPVGASRLGKKVIELEHISKGFAGSKLIEDFSYVCLRNDRVGIIGPNGSGKSTLLNIVSGSLNPDSGTVERGQTVITGYFSQENNELDESLRAIDYIKEEAEVIPTADGKLISASQMLERFLFPPGVQWTPIAKLSGGERRRLYLLRVLMGAPNVLLLDEPTNDLDIQTLTILEDYLDEFPGAVIVVSHDRYFLDRIVDKIFAFEGNGVVTQYLGDYSEYQEYSKIRSLELENSKAESDIVKKDNHVEKPKDRRLKFTFKEQKEYAEIDGIIAQLEKKLKEVNERINQAGSDFALLQELVEIQQGLEKQLDELLERWTYLNELAEEIARNNNR
ncbi:MAG: ABC-F family ATP-binding cassette domain-containing protein [Clostridia bacterium]|nr:ABC-F family ATP-binding cassette domain-containing protein [Clostridia bacterium]